MKKEGFCALLVFFLICLAGVPALYAEVEFSEVTSAPGEDYSDPSAFEGEEAVPGERAPENPEGLDTPSEAGIQID